MSRIETQKLEPNKRIKNFDEVDLGFSRTEAMEEAARCIDCKKPMCHSECPVGIDIPGFIKEIKEGRFEEAIKVIRKSSNLPAICGRVCPQERLCEKQCVFNKKCKPLNVGKLERFAAEFDTHEIPKDIPKRKEKIAVIGSGPAGLTCAGDLAKLGYKVTIFEAMHTFGGVLVYGIPRFRLPLEVVNKEIDYIRKLGVQFKKNTLIGRTIEMEELKKDFDAIFIGCGAGLPRFMEIPGEGLKGVYSANEFLTRINLMQAHLDKTPTPVTIGKKVVVVGGGNTAMDAARTARRLGADVTIVYRRGEEEMPARNEEIHHAKEEGIHFMILTNPVEILGEHKVEGVRCVQMMLDQEDDSGRRKPIPLEGSKFEIEADQVIVAIGQGCNPLIAKSSKVQHSITCAVHINEEMMTSQEGIFAGGDIIGGDSTVIQAMMDGKKAAKGIDLFLKQKEYV